MYAYLEGEISYKSPTMIYLDVHGVGYEIYISLNTYSSIQHAEKIRLYTYLQVKEDSHTIYGFADTDEKEMFLKVISISGIGAATARMMLSSLKPDEIRTAIIQGNTRLIESVKGIGKKTAERLVLELRDKMGKSKDAPLPLSTAPQTDMVENDAVEALVSLGIARPVAYNAVKKVITNPDHAGNIEHIIKSALRNI